MNNHTTKNRRARWSRWLLLASVFVLPGGCGKTPDSGVSKTAERTSDVAPTIDSRATTSETDSGKSEKSRKVVFDIPAFLDDALNGRIESIYRAIETGVDVNAVDDEQRTALLMASFNGHTSIAKRLLENGALLDHRDAMGRTALMFAATGDNAELVELLLKSGAEVNAVDSSEGFSALMFAAAEGQVEVVKVLLKHHADPAIRDVDGDTAQDFATQNHHDDVVKLFVK